MTVERGQRSAVEHTFMKTIDAFGPQLDGLEPQSVAAPEIGTLQPRARASGLAGAGDSDLRGLRGGSSLELGRVVERLTLPADPGVDLAAPRPSSEVRVAF